MEIKRALAELQVLFNAMPNGKVHWQKYYQLFEMEPSEALAVAESAVRDMQYKKSVDDRSFFGLQNELNEKLLVYNLLLRAIEDKGEVNLTEEAIKKFKEETSNCALMDYGAYVDVLLNMVTEDNVQLPSGIQDLSYFSF